jgi:uroporphyrinogen-III decarboxylase
MAGPNCEYLSVRPLLADIARRKGLDLVEAHGQAGGLAALAAGVKESGASVFCNLPLCCTVEAEALGAVITFGDGRMDPRAGAPFCRGLEEILDLQAMDLSSGRIAAVLEACSLLHARGEHVALEISGPLTILNWIVDLMVLFREWRKNVALMLAVLARLQEELFAFALAAGKSGVTLLSFADPLCSFSLLGPKRFAFLAEEFVLPFLRRLKNENVAPLVHVCPQTSRSLVQLGLASWKPLRLAGPCTYTQGCLEAQDRALFLGEACIKNDARRLPDGVIKELILRQGQFT